MVRFDPADRLPSQRAPKEVRDAAKKVACDEAKISTLRRELADALKVRNYWENRAKTAEGWNTSPPHRTCACRDMIPRPRFRDRHCMGSLVFGVGRREPVCSIK